MIGMRVFVLLSLGLNALAATVSLKWNVEYVSADPDKSGHSRRVIGVNGKWPPPRIDVNLGDQVRVEVTNKLNDWNTTLHWHGIRQKGSNNYDGPEYVTQCPIPSNDVMVYNFPVRSSHSGHLGAQRRIADGARRSINRARTGTTPTWPDSIQMASVGLLSFMILSLPTRANMTKRLCLRFRIGTTTKCAT